MSRRLKRVGDVLMIDAGLGVGTVPAEVFGGETTEDAYRRGRREAIEEAEKAVMSLPDGTWGDETGERCPWPIAAKAIRAITKGPARGE